jgi:peptide/nickel transport system ATP-binding protein
MATLLEVKDLVTQFHTESGLVRAVNGVSYNIDEQEIIGLVGESGCGKSVSQLSVMQLINAPGEIADGEIIFRTCSSSRPTARRCGPSAAPASP